MTPLLIGPRDVLALRSHVRSSESLRGPVLVSGKLADQLARQLAEGAEPGAVRTVGDPKEAAALVFVVGGDATAEDERVLRAATRALVPLVVVQLGEGSTRLPYVLPTDVVTCRPGKGFPIDDIGKTLARTLGKDGAAVARAVPALRNAFQEQRAEESTISAATMAVTGGDAPKLPLLALAQARALADISTARGDNREEGVPGLASMVGAPLGAALGTGLAARALVRRLPVRNRLVEAAVAAGATYALVTAFRRLARR
jgi:hypothetical protein